MVRRPGFRLLGMLMVMGALAAPGTASASAEPVGLVRDIQPGADNGFPDHLTAFGDVLLFTAQDALGNAELWRSDGTEAGTQRVKDINPFDGSSPRDLTVLGDVVLFTADDATHGEELWRTDGTEAGTYLVKDINPASGSRARPLAVVGGQLFFSADDGTHGVELWRTDGTEAGTQLVKDIDPAGSSEPVQGAAVGGVLLFNADDGTTGGELWRSDGTEAGTTLVKDIRPAGDGSPLSLTDFGGIAYFTATDGGAGFELWRSDGTGPGTYMLKDIEPMVIMSGLDSSPGDFTVVDDTLFFAATTFSGGRELWKTDGTTVGTTLVKEINPAVMPPGSGWPTGLAAVGDTLYFGAGDGVNGTELWRSDGTEAGTYMVKNIHPTDNSGADEFVPFGSGFFLRADGQAAGGFWWSEGTEASTVPVADIDPLGPDVFSAMTVAGGRVFFKADDGVHGVELWAGVPRAEVATDPIAFAARSAGTASAAQPVEVRSVAPARLDVESVTVSGSGADSFQLAGGGCGGAGLETGESCEVGVLFAPTSAGDKAAQLVIDTNDPGGPVSIPLTGSASAAPAAGGGGGDAVADPGPERKPTISIGARTLRLDPKGRVGLRLTCPASAGRQCRGTLTLRTRKRVVLAKAGFRIAAGGSKTVRVRLSRSARRLVRRSRAARTVRAIVTLSGGSGATATVGRTLNLRLKRP
jgi:ELWxxDGT repeat protein